MPASPAPASDSLAVDSLAVDSPPVESPPIEPPPGEAPARSSEGYRIQVYSLRDQNAAIRAQQEVREGLRDLQVGVYIEEEPPYYKIRVGDYPSKADAEAVIGLLRKRYPDAWIVKTVIYLPH
jgi:cell division septation protein DedD